MDRCKSCGREVIWAAYCYPARTRFDDPWESLVQLDAEARVGEPEDDEVEAFVIDYFDPDERGRPRAHRAEGRKGPRYANHAKACGRR